MKTFALSSLYVCSIVLAVGIGMTQAGKEKSDVFASACTELIFNPNCPKSTCGKYKDCQAETPGNAKDCAWTAGANHNQQCYVDDASKPECKVQGNLKDALSYSTNCE